MINIAMQIETAGYAKNFESVFVSSLLLHFLIPQCFYEGKVQVLYMQVWKKRLFCKWNIPSCAQEKMQPAERYCTHQCHCNKRLAAVGCPCSISTYFFFISSEVRVAFFPAHMTVYSTCRIAFLSTLACIKLGLSLHKNTMVAIRKCKRRELTKTDSKFLAYPAVSIYIAILIILTHTL